MFPVIDRWIQVRRYLGGSTQEQIIRKGGTQPASALTILLKCKSRSRLGVRLLSQPCGKALHLHLGHKMISSRWNELLTQTPCTDSRIPLALGELAFVMRRRTLSLTNVSVKHECTEGHSMLSRPGQGAPRLTVPSVAMARPFDV